MASTMALAENGGSGIETYLVLTTSLYQGPRGNPVVPSAMDHTFPRLLPKMA